MLKFCKNISILLILFILPDVDFAGKNAGDVDVLQVEDGRVEAGLVQLAGRVPVHQVGRAWMIIINKTGGQWRV